MVNLWLIGLIILLLYIINYLKNWNYYKALKKFPGPTAIPILGNSLDFATNSHGIFMKFMEFSDKYGRFYRIWNNGKAYIICNDPRDVEVVLSSNVHLYKNEVYKFLLPWIGNGLISATDVGLWKHHRKIITPTFHFKILNDFMTVFIKNASVLCELLKFKVGKGPFDVCKCIKLLALDNICETAMGIDMKAQENSENSYVKAVQDITYVITMRMFKVWLMIDTLFNLSKYSNIQKKALQVLHGTTNSVIKDGRKKFQKAKKDQNDIDCSDTYNEKKKLAFLHVLLQSEEGSHLSDKEIREEVNTFMFAGHDTISSGMSFTLYCLSETPDVQEKAYKEQFDIFGNSERQPTYADIQEMKYLERVLKEVQRTFPSIPIIGRELHQDLELPENYTVPKGTQLCINIYSLHHNPKVWTNPYKFDPDNFLPEAVQSRSPYAFVPFSAGPRNCIGQKYAMLVMKITLSAILRQYKILPNMFSNEKPMLAGEIVLLSKNGLHICVEPRY